MRSDLKREELYFRLTLTENEHFIVEQMIKEHCEEKDMIFHYYRRLKTGHIPMVRECKVEGEDMARFKIWMEDNWIKPD